MVKPYSILLIICSILLLSSTAPHSSPSNITIRTRKRSRTSSAGGDSLAIHKKLGKSGNEPGSECKAYNPKCRTCLLSNSLKNLQKTPKTRRSSRPKVGSLQNAVVLAPFHTLKKCFQTKLIDFYSSEKMKKINNKTKMEAKKRNMSFEYDIIELKPPKLTVKKEGKALNKPGQKTKLVSYCQCGKSKEKIVKKLPRSKANLKRKTSGKKHSVTKAVCPSSQLKTKRRKPSCAFIPPMTLKAEFSPTQRFFNPDGQSLISDPGLSTSALSTQSKGDSWETYSNSPSSKEEYMEGAFAISTTSFDCYLEHFDKGDWDVCEITRGKECSRRSRPVRNLKISEPMDADLIEKPLGGSSKHLIRHMERNTSDGQIVDFMDREPQTQVISSEESNQHLQPLRRQSRTKAKKPECESATGCCPRPLSFNKARMSQEVNRVVSQAQRQELKLSNMDEIIRTKTLQVEVATQVEEGIFTDADTCLKNSQLEPSASDTYCVLHVENPPEELPCGSSSCFSSRKAESLPQEPEFCDSKPFTEIDTDKNQTKDIKTQRAEARENSNREFAESKIRLNEVIEGPTTPPNPRSKTVV